MKNYELATKQIYDLKPLKKRLRDEILTRKERAKLEKRLEWMEWVNKVHAK